MQLLIAAVLVVGSASFVVQNAASCHRKLGAPSSSPFVPTTTSLAASSSSNQPSSPGNNDRVGDTEFRDQFEWQELRAQLDAIQKQGVASRQLDPTTRSSLVQFARNRAVRNPPSSTQMEKLPHQLPGTSWRLVLSNNAATLGDLPQDATVYLNFVDSTRVDYVLQFSKKTFGLDSITAKSTYTVDAVSGLLTFVYQDIVTDLFGFKNLGVGTFGLLQGRANYVETAYFDGDYWIERGAALSSDGQQTAGDFINVYVRQQDESDNWR